jgi:microcompartment protein CcmK/EutM
MVCYRAVALLFLVFGITVPVSAQAKKGADEHSLEAVTGVVEKADKDTVIIKPRAADGKFQKAITLKVTGTSKVTILAPQKRGDKMVLTQREAAAADLVAGQAVAIIYAEAGKDGAVLLSAVGHPMAAK